MITVIILYHYMFSFIFHAVVHGDRFAGLIVALFEHLFFIYIYHEIFHFVFHAF